MGMSWKALGEQGSEERPDRVPGIEGVPVVHEQDEWVGFDGIQHQRAHAAAVTFLDEGGRIA